MSIWCSNIYYSYLKVTKDLIETIYNKKPWPNGIYHLALKEKQHGMKLQKYF